MNDGVQRPCSGPSKQLWLACLDLTVAVSKYSTDDFMAKLWPLVLDPLF